MGRKRNGERDGERVKMKFAKNLEKNLKSMENAYNLC